MEGAGFRALPHWGRGGNNRNKNINMEPYTYDKKPTRRKELDELLRKLYEVYPMISQKDLILTTVELIRLLEISRADIRELRENGTLPYVLDMEYNLPEAIYDFKEVYIALWEGKFYHPELNKWEALSRFHALAYTYIRRHKAIFS